MSDKLAGMRRDYLRDGLSEQQAPQEPLTLFRQWLAEAVEIEQPPVEANAMQLATCDVDGQPHSRVLLLKGLDEHGFVFFGNYESAKGQQLALNPKAAMTFFWPAMERQVRITGLVERISASESDAYYNVRPLGSRIGAWASPQSHVISGREELDQRLAEAQARWQEQTPTRPEFWGGYRLVPQAIEFWQGRASRLHDRLRYRQVGEVWLRERLAP
ncbi:pyridoxamine 5'-phosphate oxidase [Atopomonas sediminilitoris]|uniref:pyridoxamine 5'-phosphate oxidase n=1 Tax=Atopomonas sediminilitoris TaxID=2919919 RepID=UPI001F4E5981|nr:pyridoxamine 5'-phosphate oxidase [Atopomonas sediminilitoris]MCJ8170110.1 pyridoxamine 5'-phosphate oxidase [Atopomonas sediminilitoris]